MRYYYSGNYTDKKAGNVYNKNSSELSSYEDIPGLIIEDDTVYEIDEECIRCRRKRQSEGRRL